MGERLPCKQEVSGSNPLVSITARRVVVMVEKRTFFDRQTHMDKTMRRETRTESRERRAYGGCLGALRR